MDAIKEFGKLKVVGTDLCDEKGNPIQLKGPSTLGLVWYPDYINREAFRTVRDWGANAIRLAMYTVEEEGYLSDGDQAFTEDLIDKGVKYATELGMYVIIDWHILSDGNPMTHVEESKVFFTKMTEKYKDYTNVIYEICNEPNGDDVTWEVVKGYAEIIVPLIRKTCPESIIMIGTPSWSQRVDQAAENPVEGTNLMYSLHYYAETHRQPLRDKLIKARKKGLPVFISEYSICDASGNGALNYDEANEWARLADENKIGFMQWNLANRNESSSMVKVECTKLSDWAEADLTETGIYFKKRMSGEISFIK